MFTRGMRSFIDALGHERNELDESSWLNSGNESDDADVDGPIIKKVRSSFKSVGLTVPTGRIGIDYDHDTNTVEVSIDVPSSGIGFDKLTEINELDFVEDLKITSVDTNVMTVSFTYAI